MSLGKGKHFYFQKFCNVEQQRKIILKTILKTLYLTNYTTPKDIQIIPFELNLRKERQMFMCIFRPLVQNKQYFSENPSRIVDHYSSIYECIIPGDFNMEQNSLILISVMQSLSLFNIIIVSIIFNIIQSNTCFKGKVLLQI